jgi:hypothetical protein
VTTSAPPSSTLDLESVRRALAGRYTLERELGRGGMGTVYLARDVRLDRLVALKILLPAFAHQAGLRDRFLLETRVAASFSHPNIVPVYAVEEASDYLAYAMGLVEGETLTQRVARMGPLPVREIVRLLQDVGYALAYAHGRGVVHRDIKPDNVMLERATGRALVLDFGISRSMTPVVRGAGLTRVGEVVGTPEYMSPEQASGDEVDGRSDVYALGLVAYFAATGETAMVGDSTQKILVRQLTDQLPPIARLRADLPSALAGAIDRCVEKDPGDRFAAAEALVEEIDAAQLAEREIPVPVRMFASELSTLMLVVGILLLFTWVQVQHQLDARVGRLDVALPVVLLLSLMIARIVTTMSEGRRLVAAGFPIDEVMRGLHAVVAERSTRRAEVRAQPETRRRRRTTIAWSVPGLAVALLMAWTALRLRVRVSPTQWESPAAGILLIFSACALFGASLVLLIASPLRMPLGELLFRIVWLGPVGRSFIRLSAVGLPQTPASLRTAARTGEAKAASRRTPAVAIAATPPHAPVRPRGTLEERVAALERWRHTLDG